MLRFVLRTAGYWLVAASLVTAVVDGAKSIAASTVVLTPLSEVVALLGDSLPPGGSGVSDRLTASLLAAPLVVVLAVLGFLLLAAGRRRRSFAITREFAT